MNCTTCSRWLHDYVDGTLTAAATRDYETHLTGCAEGRKEVASLRRLRTATRALPREIAPERDLWAGLKDQIAHGANPHFAANSAATAHDGSSGGGRPCPPISSPAGRDARHHSIHNSDDFLATPGRTRVGTSEPNSSRLLGWFAPLAMAASIAILATFAERHIVPRNTAGWSVAALSGTPRVDARDVRDETRMHVGQWLVTDDAARAKVIVGSIGEVSLEPNSRLRLVGMAATDHRLELARGTLNAMIWAPPRLFFVNTPSATAVDLGCAYTLKVDDEGNGELQVTFGFVALEARGRESILRTGMMCLTRRGVGPGTPFAVDAPEALRTALTRFDFERGASLTALDDVLAHARPEDSITLWHLLDRTKDASRASVFDQLAKYSAPPASVSREGILAGDAAMRRAWGNDLGIDRF